jgi:glycosyltransferase involved in cell wall biosynthesis
VIKVIHVCAYYAPAYTYGGPARSLHALCQAQQTHGIDVEVFTTTAAGGERLSPAPLGRRFEGIAVRYFDLSAPAMLLGSGELPPALSRALPRADVVHLHGLFNRTIWAAADRLHGAGKPYILSPRGMLEAPALAHHRWRKRLAWAFKDRAIVQRAARLHATSTFERATLQALGPDARVVTIPNPVSRVDASAEQMSEVRASLGIAMNDPIVLSLGRLHRIKRLDLMASSFLSLWQRMPSVHLVIAGPDEHGLRPELEQRLAPAGAAVHWMGTVDGSIKQALLATSTALVQCSDSESFGMSVAEALAAGTPVVVTRTCPWQEIQSAGCGFWVPQTPDAIANALYEIVTNPDLAAVQGHAGRRFIHEYMAPFRVAQAWDAAYRDAMCARRAAA